MKITLDELEQIGWMFDLKLNLPPFDGNCKECFFDIEEIKYSEPFSRFITLINQTKIHYEYAKKDDKIFLIINTKDLK